MDNLASTKTRKWKTFNLPPRMVLALTAWRALRDDEATVFAAVVANAERTHEIVETAYGKGKPIAAPR
jgi:hypothetical protein